MIRAISPRFAQTPLLTPPRHGLLNAFDFERPGLTATPMNMAIYGSNIVSRLFAARSPNELWENARRDGLSWTCWFYTTPVVQRLVILMAPEKVKKVLLRQTPMPKSGVIRQLNWRLNPLTRWHLTSSSQILEYLEKPQYAKMRLFLNQLRTWRTGASAVALGMAFFMLGIGINLINIAITRKNVEASKSPKVQQGRH